MIKSLLPQLERHSQTFCRGTWLQKALTEHAYIGRELHLQKFLHLHEYVWWQIGAETAKAQEMREASARSGVSTWRPTTILQLAYRLCGKERMGPNPTGRSCRRELVARTDPEGERRGGPERVGPRLGEGSTGLGQSPPRVPGRAVLG